MAWFVDPYRLKTISKWKIKKCSIITLDTRDGYRRCSLYPHRVAGGFTARFSKRALLTFIYGLNKRLAGTGVSINAVTPGWTRTGMANNNGPFWHAVMDFLRLFMQPVEAGIQPIIHLATAPEMRGISGCYYRRFELMSPNPTWASDVVADQLWEMSELMLGLTGRSQWAASPQPA